MDEECRGCEIWKYLHVPPPSQLCQFGLRLYTVNNLHFCSCRHASGRYQDLYSSSVVSCFSLVFIAREFGVGAKCPQGKLGPVAGDGGGGGVLRLIFAGYVWLASQSPYPIKVYSLAYQRPISVTFGQTCDHYYYSHF